MYIMCTNVSNKTLSYTHVGLYVWYEESTPKGDLVSIFKFEVTCIDLT